MIESNRIMLWGWFGFKNVGDDLLLNAVLRQICDGTHNSVTIPMNEKYNLNKERIEQVERDVHILMDSEVINSHDILLIGPGGLFPIDDMRYLLFFFRIVRLWKKSKKKVIFYGIGISEALSIQSSILWHGIVSMSNMFLTRNPKFFSRIHYRETRDKHVMPDAVFGSVDYSECVIYENRAIVAVANLSNNKETEGYIQSVKIWKEIVSFIVEKGFSVDLIAFTSGNDETLVTDIVEGLNIEEVKEIKYCDAQNTIRHWNEYSFAVCMRFHALVLSIIADCPAISLAYGQKTINLAEQCNLEDYLLKWNPYNKDYFGSNVMINSDNIIAKINQLLSNLDSVRVRLSSSRKKEMLAAQNAYVELKEFINTK